MSKILHCAFAFALCASAQAARFEAGKGVANDRATGAGPNDVTFVTRGNGNAYGWRGWNMAIGGTILPWSIPNDESNVYGLRVNLGWGAYANTYGIDVGARLALSMSCAAARTACRLRLSTSPRICMACR